MRLRALMHIANLFFCIGNLILYLLSLIVVRKALGTPLVNYIEKN